MLVQLVDTDHILSAAIGEFRSEINNQDPSKSILSINDIEVAELSVEDINDMLVELMDGSGNQMVELAKLVHQTSHDDLLWQIVTALRITKISSLVA